MLSPTMPNTTHRLVIVGQSGSGKSVAGAWHLFRHTDEHWGLPWFVFNPKRDALLDGIGSEKWKLGDKLPRKMNGKIFNVHYVAGEDDVRVEHLMKQIVERGHCGMYIDEGYSVPRNSPSFTQALTQGRSKHVPMIILSQRPVDMKKFVFTEASMYRVFFLMDAADRKRIKENTGLVINDSLPSYFSHWYEVNSRQRFFFSPGPDEHTVSEMFADRNARTATRRL